MTDLQIERFSVALTDVFVLIACLFAYVQIRKIAAVRSSIKNYYLVLFLSVGIAALSGAVYHQWFEDAAGFLGTLPRFITMISIGYAAMNIWLIAGELLLSGSAQVQFQKIFRLLMYIYIGMVVLYEQQFWVAIAFYIPAVFFFLLASIYRFIKHQEKIHVWAIVGLIITVLAATIQFFQISLVPVYINPSSFYHLIQLPGIYLLYRHAEECCNWLPNH